MAAGFFVVGLSALGGGVASGFGVAAAVGDGGTAVFAAPVFGVGVAFGSLPVSAGIGTKIIPLSFGMNGLPAFGSMVTVCPGGGT